MKRLLLVSMVIAAFALFTGSAMADSIDFNATGGGGTWTWAGTLGSTLTASYNGAGNTANLNGGTPSVSVGSLSFTTGSYTGMSGGSYNFGSGGSITVAGCSGVCFSGVFNSLQIFQNATGGISFTASFVSGTVDSALLSALGFPGGTPTGVTGFITGNMLGSLSNPSAGGLTTSTDLTVTPVPEPATLGLLGAGLLGLGLIGLSRKKRREA